MEVRKIEVKFLKDGRVYGYRQFAAGDTGQVYDADLDHLLANGAVELIAQPAPEIPAKKTWNFQTKQWEYETSNTA